ncbi:hypothetical protein [Natronobacterium texcoconense]|uniref:DUF7975 domain-containing protein n=1 Tax=Natronobacterium texcoconense TaxID=1095778 RepID=A0A1H1J449_NATTX|nr:hypothetical protein [Natronobacterium texcoconense]SDR44745.1 hypothetical protein SAMN04489842_4108 [Natronobacterium texcoconense]
MTRFDASDPAKRRELYVDAIAAHQTRDSGFLTLQVDTGHVTGPDDQLDPELDIPWIQFCDGTVNLDCTPSELEELESVLEEFPAFRIDERTSLEDAGKTNLQVSANVDTDRIAQFVDAVFRRVYDLPEEFRVWVVDI